MFMYLCNKSTIIMRVRHLEIIKEQSKKEDFSTKTIFSNGHLVTGTNLSFRTLYYM